MKKTVAQLKTFFETGDVPTQQQFWDWLDSFIHKDEGKVITATENVPEGFKITYSDDSEDLIPAYELENQNISFITGLQTFIDIVNGFMSGHVLTDNNFTNQNLQDLTDLMEFMTEFDVSFNLQNITDFGNETTNQIITTNSEGFEAKNSASEQKTTVRPDGIRFFYDLLVNEGFLSSQGLTSPRTWFLPNEDGTIALAERNLTINGVTQNLTQNRTFNIEPLVENAKHHTSKTLFSLANNVRNENIFVLSDSTGVGTEQWAYLLMLSLAAKFTNVTVYFHEWNLTTLEYNSPVLIQTGTETTPKILNYYFGCVSGSGIAYCLPTFEDFFPVNPDLVLVSYGHNDNYGGIDLYKRQYNFVINKIAKLNQEMNIVLVAQNPKSKDEPTFENGVLNAYTIMEIATEQGYGFINVMQAFFDFGDYDTILLEDGVHPNAEGKTVFFELIEKSFKKTNYSRINTKIKNDESIFIGAANTLSNDAVLNYGTNFCTRTFTNSNRDKIFANCIIPAHWKYINTYVLFYTPIDGTGSVVVFDANFTFFDENSVPEVGLIEYGIVDCADENIVVKSQIHSKYGSTFYSPEKQNIPASFRLERFYDNGADTFSGDVHFIGVLIEKAI